MKRTTAWIVMGGLLTAAVVPLLAQRSAAAQDVDPKKLRELRFQGRDLFVAGKVKEAIEAFDKLEKLDPSSGPSLWERGLAYYYAGRYADAAKQFSAFDDVDKLDIENGLWHYLSLAEAEGLEKADKSWMKYDTRRRPPFPALLDLYQGKGSAEAVVKQAEAAIETEQDRRFNRFYTNLYLGKYHQIHKKYDVALKHFEEAVKHKITFEEFTAGFFMWNCAKMEIERTRKLMEVKP